LISVLGARESLAQRWLAAGLLEQGVLRSFQFGSETLYAFSSDSRHVLTPVLECKSPANRSEALAFAEAFRATRAVDPESSLQDAIYAERLSRLLPIYSLSTRMDDDVVFGLWLTGGVPVSVQSFQRLHSLMSWMDARHLREVIAKAGFSASDIGACTQSQAREANIQGVAPERCFELAGRPALERFFNEHVIDIVENHERYKTLGIDFPSAIVLHGPPGCGKTFAVERLVAYLGWPLFEIDASSVGSPYIHETSRKVAEVFEKAMQHAPSVLIIDEMEAFLADRQIGAGASHHRIEEVAEFLRRIPEAIKHHVLIIAMTNRIELIDPAILRRGRFDHLVKVSMASEEEVRSLLEKLINELPRDQDVEVAPFAKLLQGRPLSDVAFVVREGARLAARAGKNTLDHVSLEAALQTVPPRESTKKMRSE
jgi:cell division protease FtsH